MLTLQNGLGNDERVARHVARDKVLAGIASLPADLVAPGRVRSMGEGGSRLYPAFGGDVEFAFTPNLTGKVEYLYVDLGNQSCAAGNCGLSGGGGTLPTSVSLTENIVRAGINYKFW